MFMPLSPQAWKGGSGGEGCVHLCVGTWVSRVSSSKGEEAGRARERDKQQPVHPFQQEVAVGGQSRE